MVPPHAPETPDAPPPAPAVQPQPIAATPPQQPMTQGAGTVLPAGVTAASPWVRLGSYFVESILVFVTLGIGWLIWASTTAGTGQTPAKRLLKLRVVDATSLQPVGFGKMFWMRGLIAGFVAGVAFFFTLGILLFMPFWTSGIRTSGTRSRAPTSSTTRMMPGRRSPISARARSRLLPTLIETRVQ